MATYGKNLAQQIQPPLTKCPYGGARQEMLVPPSGRLPPRIVGGNVAHRSLVRGLIGVETWEGYPKHRERRALRSSRHLDGRPMQRSRHAPLAAGRDCRPCGGRQSTVLETTTFDDAGPPSWASHDVQAPMVAAAGAAFVPFAHNTGAKPPPGVRKLVVWPW